MFITTEWRWMMAFAGSYHGRPQRRRPTRYECARARREHLASSSRYREAATPSPNPIPAFHRSDFLEYLSNHRSRGDTTTAVDTMPPKQRAQAATGTAPITSPPAAARSSRPSSSSNADAQDIVQGVWNKYVQKTPQRTKLLDTFMAFLVGVGALQFLYVVLVGNFVRLQEHVLHRHSTTPFALCEKLRRDGFWGH